jgi:hypothetical protein
MIDSWEQIGRERWTDAKRARTLSVAADVRYVMKIFPSGKRRAACGSIFSS